MDNVKALPKQNVTESDVETMKNECRFMIAYYYWMMTLAYGAVPYYDDDMTSDSPDLMRGQKSFEWMVDWWIINSWNCRKSSRTVGVLYMAAAQLN